MFRITQDPSSGSVKQYLTKIMDNGLIVQVAGNAPNNLHDWTVICNFNEVLFNAPWWCILRDPKHVGVVF
jgi:hypothetical protein